jgi:predicted Zn finger-like uncharacterized protein
MLIVCPNCATSYDVDVASLRPNGRRVRCVRCRSVWEPELPHAEKLIAAAEDLVPTRRALEAVAAVAENSGSSPAESVASAEAAPPAPEPPVDVPVDGAASGVAEEAGFAAATQSVEVDSPPIAPAHLDAGEAGVATETKPHEAPNDVPHEDIETVAGRRYPRRAKRKGWHWPLSHLQSAFVGLIIANAIIIGWRADFVRAMPQTASFYALIGMPVNLRGLDFDSLTTASEQHEGVPILVVEGNIVNDTNKTADVPHVRFAVRNAARQEIYSWTAVPSRTMLPPGEAIAFHSRLASPPPDAHDVLVRFVNRYDMLNGSR